MLSRLRKENKITGKQYQLLYPTTETVPRIYCTPKSHKPGNPLRSIVNYTWSIGYNTSSDLADLLAPLVGKTPHHTQNSKDLAEELSTICIQEGDIFNSHDVVSLFTNTHIQEALKIVEDKLKADHKLKDRTKLSAADIMELLSFITTTTYFSFRGTIYQQNFGTAMGFLVYWGLTPQQQPGSYQGGDDDDEISFLVEETTDLRQVTDETAMGSPVSPVLANIFMEWLEQEAIVTAPQECKPKLWKRYVDGILELITQGQVENLTNHLNTIDPTRNTKFTHTPEVDGQIPFLDTLMRSDEMIVQ